MNLNAQNKSNDRQPVAAGKFYPADKNELTQDLENLFGQVKTGSAASQVIAIIAPHAGYIFSGKTAAEAFSVINKNHKYKNIFLVGSSHVMAFNGASIYCNGDYVTPLGAITANKTLANKLKNENKVFNFPTAAHNQEHSLEVLIPFIQYYFNETPEIIPIIIGADNISTVKKIAEALEPYFTADNLFIISSDFSHYPSYNDAVAIDNCTVSGIISGDSQKFLETLKNNSGKNIDGLATSMCGWAAALMLLYMSENNDNLEYRLIDYSNSGNSEYGGKDRVVGYNAIALCEKNAVNETCDFSHLEFNEDEKNVLFEIVRKSIEAGFYNKEQYRLTDNKIPDKLKQSFGAFVTLKLDGQLRGCVGNFFSSKPLYEVVKRSALSAAFEDSRFLPLTKNEFENIEVEITVLGQMKQISDASEIILGKHGVYIKKGYHSGTLLPQVAIEQGCTVEQFLGYTSRDKAGLGWDGWKTAEIYIYEGIILEE